MKRVIALFLSCAMLLTGCAGDTEIEINVSDTASSEIIDDEISKTNDEISSKDHADENDITCSAVDERDSSVSECISDIQDNIENISFLTMNDPELLRYVEDSVYSELVEQLGSDDYFVENVQAAYMPKEYYEEIEFNSQENIYFGYKASELNEIFQGQKYIFTLDENGQTTVQEMAAFRDNTYDTVMRNVAIGTGVILICVTVSVVSPGVGAHAVSMIIAGSAKEATTFAIKSAALGGVSAAIVKGIETRNVKEMAKAATLEASEGFKWGAITGAVLGGVSEGKSLYGSAKQTEFTMNQYAKIQRETKYPLDVIKEFHNMEEYQVFKDANLKSTMVGNKSALIKSDIDLTRIDSKGRTNLQRMKEGLAPQDSNGISYELHHVGQKKDGTLAILSRSEHDNPAIHGFLERTEAHAAGNNWDEERKAFWKAFASMVG
ncbi:HNH/ENDO VII family nuclease [Ruminococcus albus]|uniref:LHH domain-containing protein n=1 Tax=Ruminococcus albus (strain ATCC 27210 / DSM 20455 / JCM 14654 / NCDO 2250 / 7) TaxID=697329 RepID=E6UJN1_RUMA7|nr:HNH/ENDO VII family nuclease [Ruminococcus albus]ADU23877.1 hypothetical protein Rumal_3424 [Ruminococcus albus 7 = DSM 20455]